MERIQSNLLTYYMCVIDNYATMEVAEGVLNEMNQLYDNGCFKEKVTTEVEPFHHYYIHWLFSYRSNSKYLKILKHSINNLMTSLRFKGVPSVKRYSHFRLAAFPKNSGFSVRVDNPDENDCLLTVAYFCNKDYNRLKDGGVNRLFVYEKQSVVDVEPRFNRLLIHWSDERVAHAQCRNLTNRFSLSAWYFNQ